MCCCSMGSEKMLTTLVVAVEVEVGDNKGK